ncbi:low specificity L-threonine aldolase [Aurantimonas sp. C2-6-R+9]|uniref:threonine aldolase family protein n=1 Tax=unclassified Aurantimonas TaxID=2638230 RepID=UPI002E194602|nr:MULTISPECIES: low specificity L-threonine aldolase [unclassified Aurantimonas]MEC5289342.1 low specificity L-threonine aldolase [Aurantimonas sp. C2-3-R2]MEC5322937.1 low specificity L-threonine aldolase [Aurantimonas sp. A3-2-R12]MEC5380786.1 low specificity L-threonine aldolase [Aurantimonas sp. C2-6-R+9]MEC5410422.1 low specificity L-threonine aldolase [Aurantimonas sp. C2-4-R8]
MIFASDNWSGAHPAINAALSTHGDGMAAAYGASDLDKTVERRFDEIFEREVAVFFVGTGTAANSLAFAAVNRPGGVVLCHREAHVIEDECGAPEFFTHGARLAPIDGADGKIDPLNLQREIARFKPDFVHAGQPMAVTISQPGEAGTLYSGDEIETIARIAHARGLTLHMDGARFANGLVATGLTPAEMTWKRGVDILSFGATKNGCWCAEAVVFFDPDKARQFPYIRKRGAQLFSKTRFVAAQFMAYLEDDLWLDLAGHANRMADRLRAGIDASPHARQAWETHTNESFAILDSGLAETLRGKGAVFYDWNPPHGVHDLVGDDETLVRLVTSWSTAEAEIDRFCDLIA